MTKRQYTFLILLTVLLYLSYTIIKYEYKKYIISNYKTEQREIIDDIKWYIETANKIIEYKKSPAYKNKILKEQQWYKMKWEKVSYLTHEQTYNKYKTTILATEKKTVQETKQESITKTMTNFQKWIYFLLKKDTR